MTNPLKWNLDWKHLTRRERFLMGSPFVATEDRAYRDIVRQLNERKTSDMKAWSGLPEEIREISCCIVNALKTDRVWPSAFFVPNDPADIPFAIHFDFTDKWDRVPYAIDLVERRLGIKMSSKFWDDIDTKTFAEALVEICQQRIKQQATATDADSGGDAFHPLKP